MSTNDEYLRLPRGFFDRDEEWVQFKRQVLSTHTTVGSSIGANLLELSPLGFRDTFTKASNNAGDKVFDFADKAGRQLFLACDSTPAVLRNYCNNNQQGKATRVGFVAPLFRYRDGPTRHFSQIGYAAINEALPTNAVDFSLLQLVGAMTNLCKKSNLTIQVFINDFKALRTMLNDGGISNEEMPDFLHSLQFSTLEQRADLLKERISNPHVLPDLLDVLTLQRLGQAPYQHIHEMALAIKRYTGADVIIDTTNLHSVETVSGYAVRFLTQEGVHLGDGGQYNNFGQTFDSRVQTVRSVATGVEAISQNIPIPSLPSPENKIMVLNLGASDHFVTQALQHLGEKGFSVVYGGIPANLAKAIKKVASEGYTHLTILGDTEEKSSEIYVKELSQRITQTMGLPSQKP